MNLFSILDLILCALCAYVGMYHLALYLLKRAGNEELHFSLLCFSIALYDASSNMLYASASVEAGMLWQKAEFFFSALISLEFVNFTYCLLGRRSDLPKRIFQALPTVSLLLGLLFNQYILDSQQPMIRLVQAFGSAATYHESKPGIIWNLLFAAELFGMCYLYVLLIREYIKKRKRDLLPLVFAFFVFFVSAIVDILVATNIMLILYTVEYSFILIVLVMDSILLRRFIAVFKEVETLNSRLEEKVAERTIEIKRLADQLLVANESLKEKNESLVEFAERDSMTSLLNHAAFHRRFSELFSLSMRQSFPICAMILDIDFFKEVNDTYGHQAGDEVIKKFAETLKEGSRNYDIKARYLEAAPAAHPALRDYDIAGRYGGDEFAIALPYCGIGESRIVADRICAKTRELALNQYPELKITASVGCAVLLHPAIVESGLQMIKLADKALYQAKAGGRDKAVVLTIEGRGEAGEPR